MARVRKGGGSKKRSSSRVGGLGSKARSRMSSSRVGGLGSRARSKPSSHVGSLGSKAGPRKSSSHVGGLGSKAGPQFGTTHGSRRESTFGRSRIRRPMSHSMGTHTHYGSSMGYPRRYRSRPRSSCGCFTFFIIIAIIWLVLLAPMIMGSLNPTLALLLPIIVVIGLFILGIWFITRITDMGDTEHDDYQAKVIEHETILVVCPYCGAKNEQGITICSNCGAEI